MNKDVYKMLLFNCIVFTAVLKMCLCVTTTTTTTENVQFAENFPDDLTEIKFSVKALTDYMGKWNYMYISQLEQRMASSSIVLANIDSNIRNLQERAHAWDTFQLHVAAWNDQLSTSDRKLDIISKGQEEILELEGKLNTFLSTDYKIDKIFKKLEQIEENMSDLKQKIESSGQFRDGLLGEFATRGILSTLKLIERKLDKLQLANQNMNPVPLKQAPESKLTIKCNTPPMLEELLQDVASKIDVIFDRVSEKSTNDDDYLDDQQYSSEENLNWKKFNQPWKQTNRILEQINKSIQAINNNTIIIIENDQIYYENLKSCMAIDFKSIISDVSRNIKNLNYNLNYTSGKQEILLTNHFNEQKNYIEETLKTYLSDRHFFNNKSLKNSTQAFSPKPYEPPELNYYERPNITLCGELEYGELSGIYFLDNNSLPFYCEIRESGSWTVIQNRNNYKELQNFSMDWNSYKNGFGQLSTDFWIGNNELHALSQEDLILRIELEDFDGNSVWVEYNEFSVASESENYQLAIGGYSGNASDSLSSHNGSLFSTFDVNNDEAPGCCPCAESYGGGWWFNSCFEANLNGVYHRNPHSNEYFRGIIWEGWLGDYSLKKTKMMVKQKNSIDRFPSPDGEETTTFEYFEDP